MLNACLTLGDQSVQELRLTRTRINLGISFFIKRTSACFTKDVFDFTWGIKCTLYAKNCIHILARCRYIFRYFGALLKFIVWYCHINCVRCWSDTLWKSRVCRCMRQLIEYGNSHIPFAVGITHWGRLCFFKTFGKGGWWKEENKERLNSTVHCWSLSFETYLN